MNFTPISYEQAIELQNTGHITLLDISGKQLTKVDNEYGQLWKDNFEQLLLKTPHVPVSKILQHYNAKYVCEIIEDNFQDETNQYVWRYLYGIENKQIASKHQDNVEYVYILSNPQYPHLVKIGMTTGTVQQRVNELNASSTVHEWVPRFAIAVTKGSAYKIEQHVHKAFASLRVSSDKGGKREFFQIDPLSAFDKVREVGGMHMVGNPIVF